MEKEADARSLILADRLDKAEKMAMLQWLCTTPARACTAGWAVGSRRRGRNRFLLPWLYNGSRCSNGLPVIELRKEKVSLGRKKKKQLRKRRNQRELFWKLAAEKRKQH
ncbi:hypothetical protein ABZP36_019915 [Zizania latifolia]